MAEVWEVNDWKGVMVKTGLGTPMARAVVAAAVVGTLAFLAKQPSSCFREDGSIKPFKPLSAEFDSTYKHFLAVPLGAAAIAYLFT
jgi:hypothetical protein